MPSPFPLAIYLYRVRTYLVCLTRGLAMSQRCRLANWKILLPSCGVTAWILVGLAWGSSAGEPDTPPAIPSNLPKAPDVKVIHDLPYRDLVEGEDGSLEKNKLDIYVPRGKKDFPVIFFVHGGAWFHGNKHQFGMYSVLALSWVRPAIGTGSVNYPLLPPVQHT